MFLWRMSSVLWILNVYSRSDIWKLKGFHKWDICPDLTIAFVFVFLLL